MPKFIDEAKISVRSGNGGNGCLSFRREKFVPKGGPNGGDGGKGGDIIIAADENISTLIDFKYKKHYIAQRGEHGKGKNQHGRNGEDLVIPVPVGTVVKDSNTGQVIADVTRNEQKVTIAKGGRGGRGNARFATSTNQAPRYTEPGEEGKELVLSLELKLLADAGIIGFPNAGKSTLISRISAAKPKIADYPFTTLVPNLGVVRLEEGRSFVIADIPGIIEGAHEGTGLGIRFLKHVERTRLLVHLLDLSPVSGRNPANDYEVMNRELEKFSPELAMKPQLVVLNKMDITEARDKAKNIKDYFRKKDIETIDISAAAGLNLDRLVYAIDLKLHELGTLKEADDSHWTVSDENSDIGTGIGDA